MPKYRNKYKPILSNCNQDNKNLDRSFSSSDSSEDGKTPVHSPAMMPKFHKAGVTKSDIANKNVTSKIDDNELNCSSLDTLKDYNVYSASLDESRLDKVNNDYKGGAKDYNKRSSYYADGSSYSFKKNIDPRNSYVINNDTNLLELSMTISDCDCCTETPYSILNTINMTDSSILSSSGSEAVVQRRQRKKKRSESKKRVSFHEDIFKTMKLEDDENYTDFSRSFLQPNSVQKKDAQKGRYSWCGHGDSPYIQKSAPTRNAHSDYYSSSSSVSFFDSDCGASITDKPCDQEICQKNSKCTCKPAMSERGVPEGQEDPAMSFMPKMEIELEENEAQEAYIVEKECGYIVEDPPVKSEMPINPNSKRCDSSSDWSDVDSMTTWTDERRNSRHLASPLKKRNMTSILSGEGSRLMMTPLRQAPSNSSLLSRFLRSITERKFEVKKNKKPPKPSPLYIKGAKADRDSFKDFNDNLEKEIQDNIVAEKQEFSGEKISLKLRDIFKRHIYRDKSEELYKVYKVRSSYMNNGDSRPMLALLTDKTLYLTGSKTDNSYSNQFVIPYNELDVIMVSARSNSVYLKNHSKFVKRERQL